MKFTANSHLISLGHTIVAVYFIKFDYKLGQIMLAICSII